MSSIEYLDVYLAALEHQATCDPRAAELGGRPFLACKGVPCRGKARAKQGRGFLAPAYAYSWAVPTEQALGTIAVHSPGGVVEVGAGGGYWAMELRDRGVDVVAVDPEPPGPEVENPSWHDGRAWTPVEAGDHTVAGLYPERTLLLCWPTDGEPWAGEAVNRYIAAGGRTVAYVGEPAGGHTGDEGMHQAFARLDQVTVVALPQWQGAGDRLVIYRRP